MPNDIANNMVDTIHRLEEDNASMMKSLTDLQLAYNEQMLDLKEAKRLLQAAEKTIDDYCRGYCECCKNRDFELARCGLVNGCRDKDNWEWILSYRVKELFKEE